MTQDDLLKRIESLERDIRRFKRLGALALVLAAALGLMAATRPVPDVIRAHTFEAVDGEGRERARISATDVPGSPRIMLYDKAHVSQVAILGFNDGGAITLGPERRRKDFGGEFKDDVLIWDLYGSPEIELTDARGFDMDLGSTSTETPKTGATQETSAASIVMFGNDKKHHVIWQAP